MGKPLSIHRLLIWGVRPNIRRRVVERKIPERDFRGPGTTVAKKRETFAIDRNSLFAFFRSTANLFFCVSSVTDHKKTRIKAKWWLLWATESPEVRNGGTSRPL